METKQVASFFYLQWLQTKWHRLLDCPEFRESSIPIYHIGVKFIFFLHRSSAKPLTLKPLGFVVSTALHYARIFYFLKVFVKQGFRFFEKISYGFFQSAFGGPNLPDGRQAERGAL